MKDLETQLREEAAREKERRDPGDAFWAQLPVATWQAFQAENERRQRQWAWLRRLALPIATTCAAAAALVLVLHGHPRPHVTPPGHPIDTTDADVLEMLDTPLDEAALQRPAVELLEHWSVSPDVIVDDLTDKQLAALAERLGRG